MKKSIALLFFGMFSLSVANAQSSDTEVKIKTSAVCRMCKKTIEKAMTYEKGVKAATLDVDSKMLTVSYDPKKTDPNRLRKAVAKTGYDADDVPAVEKAYNQLDDCCKKDAKHDDSSH